MEAIKIIRYLSPVGEMMIGSYGGNLCICDWAKEKRRGTIDRRICRHLNAEYEEGTSEVIEQAVSQLREYFQGERRDFDIPIVFTGSEFRKFLMVPPFLMQSWRAAFIIRGLSGL